MPGALPCRLAMAAALLAGALAPPAAAVPPPAPDPGASSFAAFERQTMRDGRGQYLVDGDIPIKGKAALKAFWSDVVRHRGSSAPRNPVYSKDDVWPARQARALTYCVSDAFDDAKPDIVATMAAAGRQWSTATDGRVSFRHVSAQDRRCSVKNRSVVFSVEPVTAAPYVARAFFPSSPKAQRNLLIDPDQLNASVDWTQTDWLTHELGHVLGFRHGTSRPAGGICYEDDLDSPLMPYTEPSVMHYPQCSSIDPPSPLSRQDRTGALSVYGPSRR